MSHGAGPVHGRTGTPAAKASQGFTFQAEVETNRSEKGDITKKLQSGQCAAGVWLQRAGKKHLGVGCDYRPDELTDPTPTPDFIFRGHERHKKPPIHHVAAILT